MIMKVMLTVIIIMMLPVINIMLMTTFTSSSPVRLSEPGGLELLHSTSILFLTWNVEIFNGGGNS